MAILNILTAPDDRLRKRSAEIAQVDADKRSLMNDMLQTMYKDNGVGLAAVQVGVLERIIVIDLQEHDKKQKHGFYPLFMANPVIVKKSEFLVEADEGCLSLPDQSIGVARSESLTLEFLDYNNKLVRLEFSDWLARVVQHEMDHLDGKLLIDYLSFIKKDIALRKLKKLKGNAL